MENKNERNYKIDFSFRDLCILKHSILKYMNREDVTERDKKQENYLLVRLQELSHSKQISKEGKNLREYEIVFSFRDLCILKHAVLKYMNRDNVNEIDKKQENYLLVRLQELSHSKSI